MADKSPSELLHNYSIDLPFLKEANYMPKDFPPLRPQFDPFPRIWIDKSSKNWKKCMKIPARSSADGKELPNMSNFERQIMMVS